MLTIDNPVNALSRSVIEGLVASLDEFESDRSFAALLICCAGRTFVAGGDITAFDDADFSEVPFNATLARIESSERSGRAKNGKLDDHEMRVAREAGLDDALMIDILATVYINAFTNAVNHLAATEPDYPRVK